MHTHCEQPWKRAVGRPRSRDAARQLVASQDPAGITARPSWTQGCKSFEARFHRADGLDPALENKAPSAGCQPAAVLTARLGWQRRHCRPTAVAACLRIGQEGQKPRLRSSAAGTQSVGENRLCCAARCLKILHRRLPSRPTCQLLVVHDQPLERPVQQSAQVTSCSLSTFAANPAQHMRAAAPPSRCSHCHVQPCWVSNSRNASQLRGERALRKADTVPQHLAFVAAHLAPQVPAAGQEVRLVGHRHKMTCSRCHLRSTSVGTPSQFRLPAAKFMGATHSAMMLPCGVQVTPVHWHTGAPVFQPVMLFCPANSAQFEMAADCASSAAAASIGEQTMLPFGKERSRARGWKGGQPQLCFSTHSDNHITTEPYRLLQRRVGSLRYRPAAPGPRKWLTRRQNRRTSAWEARLTAANATKIAMHASCRAQPWAHWRCADTSSKNSYCCTAQSTAAQPTAGYSASGTGPHRRGLASSCSPPRAGKAGGAQEGGSVPDKLLLVRDRAKTSGKPPQQAQASGSVPLSWFPPRYL